MEVDIKFVPVYIEIDKQELCPFETFLQNHYQKSSIIFIPLFFE